jgi:hypothetical protein
MDLIKKGNSQMKKLYALLIAILLLATTVPPVASAASGDDPYLGLSEDEYRKLNKFFDPFSDHMTLQEIQTDRDVVWFGCWLSPSEDGTAEYNIPEKEVEAVLSRYFGIEKIYHEAVGDALPNDKFGMPAYRNGFYSSGNGVGGEWEWANVSSYTDNGDGTFTVVVSKYFTDLTRFLDESDNFTDSQYEPISQWQLPSDTRIIDGHGGSDLDINRLSTDTVILKPYVYNGEQTWQITNINGWDIPKVLFAPAPTATSALSASPTASTVLVNGRSVAFDAYNIGGANYFKLRDLAYILNGTPKQFEVGWDGATNAISLTSGRPYTAVGGEMAGKSGGAKTPTPTSSKLTLNGSAVSFEAYNIGGNNYFKLRDIGAALDFGVTWDGVKNTVVIDTSTGYTPE